MSFVQQYSGIDIGAVYGTKQWRNVMLGTLIDLYFRDRYFGPDHAWDRVKDGGSASEGGVETRHSARMVAKLVSVMTKELPTSE
jgi:hypothetical protein